MQRRKLRKRSKRYEFRVNSKDSEPETQNSEPAVNSEPRTQNFKLRTTTMNSRLILTILTLFLLFACDNQVVKEDAEVTNTEQQAEVPSATKTVPTVKEDILALVNGSAITQTDLDFAIIKLIGEEAAARMDEKATKKVLDSMVMSRAISQLQQKEMNDDEQAEVEREVEIYKEQLLVRRYLAAHGSPQPVTIKQIQDYYDAHPELFGSKKIKHYEMITTKRPLKGNERDELLSKLRDPEKQPNWLDWSNELGALGYPLTYRQGRDDGKTLHPKLTQALTSLAQGQVSPLILIQETPYLIRITALQEIPARPLSEVTGPIRKKLAPIQVKKTIEEVGKEALDKAVIEYR